jgi:hypothetical protein
MYQWVTLRFICCRMVSGSDSKNSHDWRFVYLFSPSVRIPTRYFDSHNSFDPTWPLQIINNCHINYEYCKMKALWTLSWMLQVLVCSAQHYAVHSDCIHKGSQSSEFTTWADRTGYFHRLNKPITNTDWNFSTIITQIFPYVCLEWSNGTKHKTLHEKMLSFFVLEH